LGWKQDVADYISRGSNLEAFIEEFFPESSPSSYGKGIRLNPAPCCGHNDCFSFSKQKNSGFCYSCGTSGSRISFVEAKLGEEAAQTAIEKWSGIKFMRRHYTPEETAVYNSKQRTQELAHKAIAYYHKRLLDDHLALEKQTGTNRAMNQRAHTMEGLREFKVGLSGGYLDFYNLMKAEGYNAAELKEAGKLIWLPEGCFVYPYYDLRGNLVRINTKLWFRTCHHISKKDAKAKEKNNVVAKYNLPDREILEEMSPEERQELLDRIGEQFVDSLKEGKGEAVCHFQTFDLSKRAREAHEKETGHKMAMDGYSTGEKSMAFYFSLNSLKGRRKAILVEGENDVISVWEELQKLPKAYAKDYVAIGLGGRMEEGSFSEPFLRQFNALYECFDMDDAGDGYRKELNEKVPDVPVYTIKQDADINDIDDFLKSALNNNAFKDMIDKADFVDSQHFTISREGYAHLWILKNRKFRMEFTIDTLHKSGQPEGTLLIFKSDTLTDKKVGTIDGIKTDTSINYAKMAFSQHLDAYYNDLKWIQDKPKRTFWELRDLIKYTKEFAQAVKQMAWHLYQETREEYEKKVKYLQDRLPQKVVAEILKEVNGYANDTVDPNMLFPKIHLSQYFHIGNNDAFFYFSKVVKEGEISKLVPCLLTNKKEEIRLDLLRRKDPQCLLLINNRYELPMEVQTAVMDSIEVSVQYHWIQRWRNDELDPAEYDPKILIMEIESFIRKCYYTTEEIYKVLALWIYATYFYMLFRSGFPYLIFNGPKGSGKSTFDTIIYLLALNPKFALDMSAAALFRTISIEGGTFILDEIEDLVDKRTVNSSEYAKVLKGGYADSAYIYRMNMDKGVSERFSVFGPKVISNIGGIEDVIGDRCIYIKTIQAPEHELRKLTNPIIFKEERRSEAHAITSRCVISALVHFQKVHELFNEADSRMDTGNARLTQILQPLIAMAKFVGGDYMEHLLSYYDREIKTVKDEIAASTTEGLLTNIIKRVAEELAGIEKEKWATNYDKHAYTLPIAHSHTSGIFEMDTMHFKVLCEENNNGEAIDLKLINATLKLILGSKQGNAYNRKQTTATIEDEGLQRQMDGKRHIRVYRYYLQMDHYVDAARIKEPMKTEGSLF
jgi:hypothetical protein